MALKNIRLSFIIIVQFYFFTMTSFVFANQDCQNSSFYIRNIKVDLTKNSINEARASAEQQAKIIGFNRLVNRLIIKNKKINFKNSNIVKLVAYLKINKEANSDRRYLADIDVCFKRSLVINFFRKNKLRYAETYREPISILPIFKGPRGFILFDEKDKWYLNWKKQINLIDGLVKLNLAKGNFYLNRNINSDFISKSNTKLIRQLIENEKSNALLIIIAEPILMNNGKAYLSTYAKFFNRMGNLENTIYRNKIFLKTTSSIYNLEDSLIKKEIVNIINSVETNWKKDNLIDTNIFNEVDLLIPITSEKLSKLENQLLFNDKVINVYSTGGFNEKGVLKIEDEYIFYNKKTSKSFRDLKRRLYNSPQKLKYKKNIEVKQKDIKIWPNVFNKLKSLPFVVDIKVVSITNRVGRILIKFMGNKKTFFLAANEKNLFFKRINSYQHLLFF